MELIDLEMILWIFICFMVLGAVVSLFYFRGWMYSINRSLRGLEKQCVDASLHRDCLFGLMEDLIYIDKLLAFPLGLPRTRGWATSSDFLRRLADEILLSKPEFVVECGSGLTTLVIARCMELNGKGQLYSFEHDPAYKIHTQGLLDKSGIEARVTFSSARLREHNLSKGLFRWYDVSDLPEVGIDMLIVDGPPSHVGTLARYPALPLLSAKMAGTSKILVDDYSRIDEREMVARWLEEFPVSVSAKLDFEKGAVLLDYVNV